MEGVTNDVLLVSSLPASSAGVKETHNQCQKKKKRRFSAQHPRFSHVPATGFSSNSPFFLCGLYENIVILCSGVNVLKKKKKGRLSQSLSVKMCIKGCSKKKEKGKLIKLKTRQKMYNFCEIKRKINEHTKHEKVPKKVMKYSENEVIYAFVNSHLSPFKTALAPSFFRTCELISAPSSRQ